jgi:uncharacterized membrane protein
LADAIANFVGSWPFIIIQSIILIIWVILNLIHVVRFDPYPFILLNLFLSFQAAYATPMILMSGNRQSARDRQQSNLDLKLDKETNKMMKILLEDIKLDKQEIEEHKISYETILEIKKLIEIIDSKINKNASRSKG